jgi:hypothetical protein
MAYEEKPEQTLREAADHLTNEAGTCELRDTTLTQPRSRSVPMDFDVKKTCDQLIAMRVKFGADTPEGHACSNLIEQLQNYETATPEAKARLVKTIGEQMKRLGNIIQ